MDGKQSSRREFLRTAVAAAGAGVLTTSGAQRILQPGIAAAASVRTASRIEKSGVLWGLQYAPHVAAYKRLATLFQQQTGSTLSVQPQPWPLEPKLIAALAAGNGPDVSCVLGSTAVPLYVQKVLRPLNDVVFKAKHVDTSEFIGDSLQAFTFRNVIEGVPVESNAAGSMVCVPVDDVNALGLGSKYPPTNNQIYFKSYPDMWQLAKALQVTRGGRIIKHGLTSTGWEYQSIFGIMRSLGVNWWDENAKKFNLDSPAGVQAMELLVSKPVQMGIEVPLPAGENSTTAPLAGKAALARGNPTAATQGATVGYHYVMCGAPDVIPGHEPMFTGEGGWGFVGFKNAKNPNLALTFLQMMATEPGQIAYGKIYDGVPFFAWKNLVNDRTRFTNASDTSPNVLAAAMFAHLDPRTVYFGHEYGYYLNIQTASNIVTSAVRSGKMTPAAAMKEFQAQAQAQYKQYLTDVGNLG